MSTPGEIDTSSVDPTASLPSPQASGGNSRTLLQEFLRPLAFMRVHDPAERDRYVEAAWALLIAGVIAFLLTFCGVSFLPAEKKQLLYALDGSMGWFAIGAIIFLAAWFYPVWQKNRNKLYHIEGTLSLVTSFSLVSFYLFGVVLHTGLLSSSAFSSAFFVVLSISYFLPQAVLMRVAFLLIVMSEGVQLIRAAPPDKVRHDAVMIGVSLVTTFFVVVARFFLDRVRENKGEDHGVHKH